MGMAANIRMGVLIQGDARMRAIFFGWAVLACSVTGCMKTEQMTAEEMQKYPRPQITEQKFDPASVRQPRPETCNDAGKMYETLAQTSENTVQKRDFAWRAKQAYGQALRLRPGWAPALSGLARVDELEGNVQQAANYYQQALQNIRDKNDAGVCHEAGLFYARHKQFDNGILCMQRAVQLDSSNRTYTMNYGYTLARAGRYEDSFKHFCQIMNSSDASFQLAKMANHLGDVEKSKQFASYALQQNPKNNQAQELLAQLEQPAVQQVQATEGQR
jgi:tetratricopeptide (TPR) repeat protein